MEILYKGQRYTPTFRGGTWRLHGSSGKHYCQDGFCPYCENSTDKDDAHYYQCAFPESSFTDDLGNRWEYCGVYHRDESPSFGWWDESHQWCLKKGGAKSGAVLFANPLDTRKIRRRVEDRLRKLDDDTLIIELAVKLGVSLA